MFYTAIDYLDVHASTTYGMDGGFKFWDHALCHAWKQLAHLVKGHLTKSELPHSPRLRNYKRKLLHRSIPPTPAIYLPTSLMAH